MTTGSVSFFSECYAEGHRHTSGAELTDCILGAISEEAKLRRAKAPVPPALAAQVRAYRVAQKRPPEPLPRRLSKLSDEKCDSPAEQVLLEEFRTSGFTEHDTEQSAGILYQRYHVQTLALLYRLDFAIIRKLHRHTIRINVEVDGEKYHRDRALEDRQRDRALAKNGWIVLRFMAKEVFADPGACVMEVAGCMAEAVDRLTGGNGL